MPPYPFLQQRHYHSTFPLPRDKTDNEHYFLNVCFLIDVSTLPSFPHLLILSLPSFKHPLRLSSAASFIAHDNSHNTYIDLQLISCLAAGLVANSCCSVASCSPIRPFPSILYDVSSIHFHQPEHSNIATILYLFILHSQGHNVFLVAVAVVHCLLTALAVSCERFAYRYLQTVD